MVGFLRDDWLKSSLPGWLTAWEFWGTPSTLIESFSNAPVSMPSTEASSVEGAVDTVDGVPIAAEGSLTLCGPECASAVLSGSTGAIPGLNVVAVTVDAADKPSSSCSFLSVRLSPPPSIFNEADLVLQ